MIIEKGNTRSVRTMIVEDQGLVRGFLERWIEGLAGFVLVASARSGEEALETVDSSRPDLIIVDYQLPGMDGLEFVRSARQIRPQFRALVVSSMIDTLSLIRIRESGVEGYLEKDSPPERLTEALAAVAGGAPYFSQRFRDTIASEGANAESIGKILSRREQQVLGLVLDRKTCREIGDLMGLSTRTVEFHRANLMSKLDAKSFKELVTIAESRGWK